MKNTVVIGFIVSILTMLVSAQTSMPPAIYVKAASIGTELAGSFEQRPTLGIGTINRGDDYNINLIRRTSPAGAITHDDGTELHYITEGAGVLVTGGVSVRPAGGGPADIEGGFSQRVSVGDAILIPEGTPHQYTAVEGVVGYLEVRFKTAQY